MTGHHHGDPFFIPELLERFSDLGDTLRIESVDRLIKNDELRITRQCEGDSEALAHTQREGAYLLLAGIRKPYRFEQVIDIFLGIAPHRDTFDLEIIKR